MQKTHSMRVILSSGQNLIITTSSLLVSHPMPVNPGISYSCHGRLSHRAHQKHKLVNSAGNSGDGGDSGQVLLVEELILNRINHHRPADSAGDNFELYEVRLSTSVHVIFMNTCPPKPVFSARPTPAVHKSHPLVNRRIT